MPARTVLELKKVRLGLMLALLLLLLLLLEDEMIEDTAAAAPPFTIPSAPSWSC